MKCSRHNDRDAVAQCASCGVGVCAECADSTADLRNSCGTLCIDCYCNEMQGTADYYRKDMIKRIIRIIVSGLLYIFGMIAIICAVAEKEYVICAVGILMCGVYTGITWFRTAKAQHEEYERTHGVTYDINADGSITRNEGWLKKILFFVIGTLFGVVVTPVRIVIDGLGIKKDKRYISELNADIISAKQL